MLIFPCHVCRTQLSADESQAGQLVRCPTCLTTLRVPAAQREAIAVGAAAATDDRTQTPASERRFIPPTPGGLMNTGAGLRAGGKRFGFNCGYCSSRLEATENMC